eukprot:scaffold1736_cov67-Phaeocystis_antarctica.AAC.3
MCGGLLSKVEQRKYLRSSQDVIERAGFTGNPRSNEDDGDEPVDPDQEIDADEFDDVVELPTDA